MKISLILIFLCMSSSIMAQKIDTTFLAMLMKSKPALFDSILKTPDHKQVQLLYTQINRDAQNRPHFKSFSYHLDPHHYFYPASTVKLAAIVFALEKVNALKKTGMTMHSVMITDSIYPGQTKVIEDTSATNGKPSIEQYIKKILLTSDNDAFNRLYGFIGRAELNKKLKQYGLINSRILNRLAIGDAGESSRHTNSIKFYNGDKLVYTKPAEYDPKDYPLALNRILVGKAYMDSTDKLVNKPFSFKDKNTFAIADQQKLMRKLIFPEAFPKIDRYNLTAEDYKLVYTYMSMFPTESKGPTYNPAEFWPTYAKMIYFGREKNTQLPPNIRIFSKYGDSYGFIIDNTYFVDFKNKIEFFLTAVVQSNNNEIYNDSVYEYETVCYPFMKNIGREIYDFELGRKKAHAPDLSKMELAY
ncbi:MAG: serine hydrolase [Pedobacter sp.]|nr:serine hydrolase [Pedobacter sp.]